MSEESPVDKMARRYLKARHAALAGPATIDWRGGGPIEITVVTVSKSELEHLRAIRDLLREDLP